MGKFIDRDLITVLIKGGLGNQLFQFASAYSLSRKIKSPILIDDLLLHNFNNSSLVSFRENELKHFISDLQFVERDNNLINKFVRKFNNYECLIGDMFPELLLRFGKFSNEFKIDLNAFQRIDFPIKINSYCNHPDLFNEFRFEIVNTISNLKIKSEWFEKISKEIIENKPIGIHVRLGDYRNLEKIYGKLDQSYFKSSLELIKRINGDKPVWLFSDEPNLAFSILGNFFEIDRVINNEESKNSLEHLLALSMCDSLICSNSTFSWWAGYILSTQRPNNLVIFPRPMFISSQPPEPHNWLPKEWLTLGREI